MYESVIFDLGGVLIDWNPRYLYRKIFNDEKEMEWFLNNICTPEWNEQQDAGRSFDEATEELVARHPEHEVAIRAWYGRWKETIQGPIHETVDILRHIRDTKKYSLYALTNWSAETFPWAMEKFDFLQWFEGIVVSGVEKTRKPFPEFYEILLTRYQLVPGKSLFIDDNIKNVDAAQKLGIQSIHFQNPTQLHSELSRIGLIGAER
ncbi:MAG: HAD family phosphatase [Bacteroidetes bacterium]|nr:HAD family phosphatase [Bacteroidota bacterium]MBS1975761.1 HAD family phosphatase [Bacteroidota bacterium]